MTIKGQPLRRAFTLSIAIVLLLGTSFATAQRTLASVLRGTASQAAGVASGVSASFTVNFTSQSRGQGIVLFGSGPGCQGLVGTATNDAGAGSTTHSVTVTGNDLGGSAGSMPVTPNTTYWYEVETVTASGVQIDNNNGKCYSTSSTVNGPGWVFTMTNATTGNNVIAFTRSADGTLTEQGRYPTGGNGSGFLTDSQGSIITTPDGKFVFAVNAGDGTTDGSIAVFLIGKTGLTHVTTVDSGGKFPLSLTYHNGWLYVLNEGGVPDPTVPGSIQGFTVGSDGSLSPISGSVQTAGIGPRQIGFDNTGSALIVTTRSDPSASKFSNIYTYPVSSIGVAGAPIVTPSSAAIPFGFSFDQYNHAVVSDSGLDEALNVVGPAGISTYSLAGTQLTPVTSLAPNGNPLTCWVEIAYKPTGEYAYATNPVGNTFDLASNPPMLGPGDESVFKIAPDGTATLVSARTGTITSQVANFAVDEDVSSDGRYLYVLSMSAPPPNPDNGSVTVFRINGDGSLTQVQTIDFPTDEFGFTGMAAT